MSEDSFIYEIPLFYISFKKKEEIEDHYKNMGFKNVKQYPAVDGRKFKIDDLRRENIISIRTFDDLKSGRTEHSGMPTLGGIGCALSHYNLWKKCVDNDYAYIIIAEDDNRMLGKLRKEDVKNIENTLKKPRSIFNSVKIGKKDHRTHFFGTNFYIIRNDTCKHLLGAGFFPIDVQLDWYVAHQATLGNIIVEGYPISKQTTPMFQSTIQSLCITCRLPKTKWFYFTVCLFVLLIVLCVIYYRHKFNVCTSSCSSSGGIEY